MKKLETTYPAHDGWIHGKIKAPAHHQVTEGEVKHLLSNGQPERYEFAELKLKGNKATVIFRLKTPAKPGVSAPPPL